MARIVVDSVLETHRFEQGANRMKRIGREAARGVAGAFRGALAGGAVLAAVDRVSSHFDKLAKLAKRLNVAPEVIQRIGTAAELAGADTETLVNALTRMNRKLNDEGQSAAGVSALASLSIDAERFMGLGLEAQLAALADAYVNAGNKSEALAMLFKLMEDDAKKLIPLFNEGGEALRNMFGEAAVVSARDIEAMEEYRDALTKLKKEMLVVGGPVIGALVRGFQNMTNGFSMLVDGGLEFGEGLMEGRGISGALRRARGMMNNVALKELRESGAMDGLSIVAPGLRSGADPSLLRNAGVEELERLVEARRERERRRREGPPVALGSSGPADAFPGASLPIVGGIVAAMGAALTSRELARQEKIETGRGELEQLREALFGARPGEVELGANRSIGSNEVSTVAMDHKRVLEQLLETEKAMERSLRELVERSPAGGGLGEFDF